MTPPTKRSLPFARKGSEARPNAPSTIMIDATLSQIENNGVLQEEPLCRWHTLSPQFGSPSPSPTIEHEGRPIPPSRLASTSSISSYDEEKDEDASADYEELLEQWIGLKIDNNELLKSNAKMQEGVKAIDSVNVALSAALYPAQPDSPTEGALHSPYGSTSPPVLSPPAAPLIRDKRARPFSSSITEGLLHPSKQHSGEDTALRRHSLSVSRIRELIEEERLTQKKLLEQSRRNAQLLLDMRSFNSSLRDEVARLRAELRVSPPQIS
mmetsp:Transcript_28969/g.43734  ORF Transcript_28969/g.43734 Transcript_28969/m.43734 type:complete len:268 (+) Transcript_28969:64-867(+)